MGQSGPILEALHALAQFGLRTDRKVVGGEGVDVFTDALEPRVHLGFEPLGVVTQGADLSIHGREPGIDLIRPRINFIEALIHGLEASINRLKSSVNVVETLIHTLEASRNHLRKLLKLAVLKIWHRQDLQCSALRILCKSAQPPDAPTGNGLTEPYLHVAQ